MATQYTFVLSASPAQGGEVSFDGVNYQQTITSTVDTVTDRTLYARPKNGYRFKWFYIPSIGNRTDNPYHYGYQDTGYETAEAVFEVDPTATFTVTTEARYAAGGTVTGGGTYTAGTTITLSATANQGYRFAGWESSAGDTESSPSFSYTVDSDITWTAFFGTRRLIYFDVSPTPPSDPGDAVVTFDFNPKTWICGVPYVHHFSLNIAYTIGASTTSFTATGQETRTITQAQLATVSTITFTITARSDTCSEGYTPPPLDVVVVVQQANVRTVFAKSSHTVNVGKNYLLTISSGAIVTLAEVP